MKAKGFSLIELMITVFLGTLLIVLLVEIYLASLRMHRLQQSIIELQDRASKVIRTFQRAISQAGCVIGPNPLQGRAHTLTVHYLHEPVSYLIKTPTGKSLEVTGKNQFRVGEHLAVTNFRQTELFTVEAVQSRQHRQRLTITLPLHYRYPIGAEISRFVREEFFLARSLRKHSTLFALFSKTNALPSNEIVEDIHALTFYYTQAGSMLPLPARRIHHWENVTGVKIIFTLSSGKIQKTFFTYIALKP